jgi:hypothetical protein
MQVLLTGPNPYFVLRACLRGSTKWKWTLWIYETRLQRVFLSRGLPRPEHGGTTRRHNAANLDLNLHCRENLKSRIRKRFCLWCLWIMNVVISEDEPFHSVEYIRELTKYARKEDMLCWLELMTIPCVITQRKEELRICWAEQTRRKSVHGKWSVEILWPLTTWALAIEMRPKRHPTTLGKNTKTCER